MIKCHCSIVFLNASLQLVTSKSQFDNGVWCFTLITLTGPKAWNSLPLEVRCIAVLSSLWHFY